LKNRHYSIIKLDLDINIIHTHTTPSFKSIFISHVIIWKPIWDGQTITITIVFLRWSVGGQSVQQSVVNNDNIRQVKFYLRYLFILDKATSIIDSSLYSRYHYNIRISKTIFRCNTTKPRNQSKRMYDKVVCKIQNKTY
jgi:hypothetical protein